MNVDALRNLLEKDRHHTSLWEANELIKRGVPADIVMSLTRLWSSGEEGMIFRWEGEWVEACIGVMHGGLIGALVDHFGVDASEAKEFTGRGFVMRAQVNKLRVLFTREEP